MSASRPDPGLRAAFLSTTYGTAGVRARLRLVAGSRPGWAAGHWTILTAWNPGGQRQDQASNDAAQRELACALSSFRVQRGHNGAAPWCEETLIVADLPVAEGARLARQLGQAAFVTGEGVRALLVWTPQPAQRQLLTERRWLAQIGCAE